MEHLHINSWHEAAAQHKHRYFSV